MNIFTLAFWQVRTCEVQSRPCDRQLIRCVAIVSKYRYSLFAVSFHNRSCSTRTMRDAVITLAVDVFFFLIAFVSEGGKAFASVKK